MKFPNSLVKDCAANKIIPFYDWLWKKGHFPQLNTLATALTSTNHAYVCRKLKLEHIHPDLWTMYSVIDAENAGEDMCELAKELLSGATRKTNAKIALEMYLMSKEDFLNEQQIAYSDLRNGTRTVAETVARIILMRGRNLPDDYYLPFLKEITKYKISSNRYCINAIVRDYPHGLRLNDSAINIMNFGKVSIDTFLSFGRPDMDVGAAYQEKMLEILARGKVPFHVRCMCEASPRLFKYAYSAYLIRTSEIKRVPHIECIELVYTTHNCISIDHIESATRMAQNAKQTGENEKDALKRALDKIIEHSPRKEFRGDSHGFMVGMQALTRKDISTVLT